MKISDLRVLINCERSGIVRSAFAKRGFDAWSCDLEPSDMPGNHLQQDALTVLGMSWHLMIGHPDCRYLTTTANRSFLCNPDRWKKRLDAVLFVWKLMQANIQHIAIENPKGVLSSHIRKPEQYIQPYEHGHTDSKMTGLWLKNLPLITPTNIVEPIWVTSPNGKRYSKTHWENSSTNNPGNARLRATTYQGIADAFASQWGDYLIETYL